MMLIANILMCVSVLPMAFGIYRHHGSVSRNGHVYYAGSGWKVGVGGTHPGWFFLYECDSLGLLCNVIHSERMWGIPLQEWESIEATVVFNTEEDAVSLQIDGEIVYTHRP